MRSGGCLLRARRELSAKASSFGIAIVVVAAVARGLMAALAGLASRYDKERARLAWLAALA
jgi:hypothetical protein